jgi:hypothetical protein
MGEMAEIVLTLVVCFGIAVVMDRCIFGWRL